MKSFTQQYEGVYITYCHRSGKIQMLRTAFFPCVFLLLLRPQPQLSLKQYLIWPSQPVGLFSPLLLVVKLQKAQTLWEIGHINKTLVKYTNMLHTYVYTYIHTLHLFPCKPTIAFLCFFSDLVAQISFGDVIYLVSRWVGRQALKVGQIVVQSR